MKTPFTSRQSGLAVLGGLALITATASLTADTLVLLDGSKVEGKLRSCDDTDCFLGTKKIPIETIGRIELQPATSGNASSKGPSIVMADGTVRPGRFEGLSLGSVVIDGKEIDRETIAVIVLTDIAASKPARDVLLLVDGSTRLGALSKCNAASCTFDERTIPLAIASLDRSQASRRLGAPEVGRLLIRFAASDAHRRSASRSRTKARIVRSARIARPRRSAADRSLVSRTAVETVRVMG